MEFSLFLGLQLILTFSPSLSHTHSHSCTLTCKVFGFSVAIRSRKRETVASCQRKIYACYIILGSITFRLASGAGMPKPKTKDQNQRPKPKIPRPKNTAKKEIKRKSTGKMRVQFNLMSALKNDRANKSPKKIK